MDDTKAIPIGFWIFMTSLPISLAMAIYGISKCVESDNQRKIEYYKAMAPTVQEWAKQGVKSIKID